MDTPISLLTKPPIQYWGGLGIAAWMLGHHVGMEDFESITFAVIVALSVRGLIAYAISTKK